MLQGRAVIVCLVVLASQLSPARAEADAPVPSRTIVEKGALVGLLVGAVAVPTYEIVRLERVCGPHRGTIHACDDEPDRSTTAFKCALVGAALGAGIGAAIGKIVTRRQTAARDRPFPPRFSVVPDVGRTRQGVVVSIGF